MDQVSQSFHLSQIKLSIEEGSLCEVARLCMPAARHFTESIEDSKDNSRPTVSLKLYRILACEAVRTYEVLEARRRRLKRAFGDV